MSKNVTVSLIQVACSENIEENVAKTIERIKEAAMKGAQVICLQEFFSTRYFPQNVDIKRYQISEPRNSEKMIRMKDLAKELEVVLIVPYYEKVDSGVYFNSAEIIDADGEVLGTTRKNHIPDLNLYHEKYYFTPGDTGYPVYKTKYGKIGVGICWDQWFPEVARILSLKGAEMLFYPTAIGIPHPDRPERPSDSSWETVMRGHAIANGIFLAAVNRVGVEDKTTFFGNSFVCDPFGEVVECLDDKEGILVQTIDLNQIEEARTTHQFFRDRRPETYSLLLKTEAISF